MLTNIKSCLQSKAQVVLITLTLLLQIKGLKIRAQTTNQVMTMELRVDWMLLGGNQAYLINSSSKVSARAAISLSLRERFLLKQSLAKALKVTVIQDRKSVQLCIISQQEMQVIILTPLFQLKEAYALQKDTDSNCLSNNSRDQLPKFKTTQMRTSLVQSQLQINPKTGMLIKARI